MNRLCCFKFISTFGRLFVCLCSVVFVCRTNPPCLMRAKPRSLWLPCVITSCGRGTCWQREGCHCCRWPDTNSSLLTLSTLLPWITTKKTAINLVGRKNWRRIYHLYHSTTQPTLLFPWFPPGKTWCFLSLLNGGLMHYPIWCFQSQPAAWPSWYGDHHICPWQSPRLRGFVSFGDWEDEVVVLQPFEKPFMILWNYPLYIYIFFSHPLLRGYSFHSKLHDSMPGHDIPKQAHTWPPIARQDLHKCSALGDHHARP